MMDLRVLFLIEEVEYTNITQVVIISSHFFKEV